MGTNQRSRASSERQKWNKIYNGLVKLLQSQQTQIATLSKERKILEHRWLSDVRLFQDRINQVKGDLMVQDAIASLEAAKSELFMGLKQREAYLSTLRAEYAENELEDFTALFNLNKSTDQKGEEKGGIKKPASENIIEHNNETLESEIRRLKQEYDKLALEKNSEVSALLSEKNFVWNQYKLLENDYASKLKSKSLEVEKAEEKVQNLIASMEHLQSSNDRKDDKVAKLTRELTKMKEESEKCREENFRLAKEVDLLRKSRNVPVTTPLLNQCTNRATRNSNFKGKQSDTKSGVRVLRKESSSVQASSDCIEGSKKGGKRSKRMGDESASALESPKLFSSTFKVPKLKNSASVVRL